MTTTTIEDLAYQIKQARDNNRPKPIVFLGAGASASAGIPLTMKIVEDVKEKFKEKPSVKKLIQSEEKDYYGVMQALTADERRELFYGYITNENVKINVTNIYLAQLLNEGYIDFILTVNFDDLILRACALFNFLPPVYDISNIKVPTTSNFREKSVIYLHGQHFGQWLLNSNDELGKIKEVVPNVFNEIKNRRTWIVIGYSGNDEILNHIENLGSFTNELYWVNYLDTPLEERVSKFINDPDANARLINGYDADSFMLKLNSELGLLQPLIIDKPFTALKQTLDNIIDIENTKDYKAVKERLEIAKNAVENAIKEFEEGKQAIEDRFNNEILIGLLKKQMIDIIISKNFDQEKIKIIEKSVDEIKNTDLIILLADLYDNWGRVMADVAMMTNNHTYYELSIEKFKKATELNSKNSSAYCNWGTSIINIARLIGPNKNLLEQSIEKFKQAIDLNPEDDVSYSNWGDAMLILARLIGPNKNLLEQSIEKFKQAVKLYPKNDRAYSNWGYALYNLAALKGGDVKLYKQSLNKFNKAVEINPKTDLTFSNLESAVLDTVKSKDDEKRIDHIIGLFQKSVEAGANSYNLACAYTLKNDKLKSFEVLERALKNSEVVAGSIEKHKYWKPFLNDPDFITLLKKYSI